MREGGSSFDGEIRPMVQHVKGVVSPVALRWGQAVPGDAHREGW